MCKCKICGNENYKINTKKFPKEFCSYKCYEEWQKWNKEPNCICPICGKNFYKKPSALKKLKHSPTCCKECDSKYRSEWFSGKNNHQFGLIGDKNASFKGDTTISNYGYVLEYCPGHPYPHDRSNNTTRVLQHRLIIERNSDNFDDIYFEIIDGWKVLKQEYEVHHINEIKTDNRLENLQILSKSDHIKEHNSRKELIRDSLGRIIGVFKREELLENPEADNQQPSLDSNIFEGSETNNRVRTDNAEDSNVDTSIPHPEKDEDIVRTTCITNEDVEITG